ncbi:hypothetical protein D3C87_1915980 [compost metagenome]
MAETDILATKPRMVSLNTSIKMAEAAPSETRNDNGEIPVKIEKVMVPPMQIKTI